MGVDISNYNKNKNIELVAYNGNQFPFKKFGV